MNIFLISFVHFPFTDCHSLCVACSHPPTHPLTPPDPCILPLCNWCNDIGKTQRNMLDKCKTAAKRRKKQRKIKTWKLLQIRIGSLCVPFLAFACPPDNYDRNFFYVVVVVVIRGFRFCWKVYFCDFVHSVHFVRYSALGFISFEGLCVI